MTACSSSCRGGAQVSDSDVKAVAEAVEVQ